MKLLKYCGTQSFIKWPNETAQTRYEDTSLDWNDIHSSDDHPRTAKQEEFSPVIKQIFAPALEMISVTIIRTIM